MPADQSEMKSWEILTVGNRLPVLREIKQPHGEASTFESTIVEVGGPPYKIIAKLGFGYGRKDNVEHARMIAATSDLLKACKEVERWWLEGEMQNHDGAPAAIFLVREAIAKAERGHDAER